jgi:hypothetical protein
LLSFILTELLLEPLALIIGDSFDFKEESEENSILSSFLFSFPFISKNLSSTL